LLRNMAAIAEVPPSLPGAKVAREGGRGPRIESEEVRSLKWIHPSRSIALRSGAPPPSAFTRYPFLPFSLPPYLPPSPPPSLSPSLPISLPPYRGLEAPAFPDGTGVPPGARQEGEVSEEEGLLVVAGEISSLAAWSVAGP
jgi:hypothetical protein